MNEIGVVFDLGLGLVLLWLLLFVGVRRYRVDSVREKLFRLRNELFILAAEDKALLSDPAYYLLRNRINAIIRFAHTMTVTRTILYAMQKDMLQNEQYQHQHQKWLSAVRRLSPEQQDRVMSIDKRVSFAIAFQLFTGSPLLWIGAIFYVPLLALRSVSQSQTKEDPTLKAVKDLRVDIIEEQAVIAFKHEECPVDTREPVHV